GSADEGVAARSSPDDGEHWSEVAALRPAGNPACDFVGAPELTADGGGGACAAWIQAIGDEDEAMVAVHRGRGAAWPRAATLLADGKPGRAAWVRVAALAPK